MDIPAAELLLATVSDERAAAAQAFRDLIAARYPDAVETQRTGWRVLTYRLPTGRGRATAEFAWVMVEPEHVHLGFSWGALMADPRGELEGQELKRVRWVTVERADQVDVPRHGALLDAAAHLARIGHRGRLALLLDPPDPSPTD